MPESQSQRSRMIAQQRTGGGSALAPIRTLVRRFLWYRQKHGLVRLLFLAIKRAEDEWIIRSEYVFVIDLMREPVPLLQRFDPIPVECYSSMESIPPADMQQLVAAKGEVVLFPFLERFFAQGARLWLGKDNGRIVGLKWTLRGGFSGFYSIPISDTDVISISAEAFPSFRGQGFWQRLTAGMLPLLKEQGVSRVYFKVHCRNHSMLRAVKKAGIPMLGRGVTFSFPGFHLTLWNKRFLKSNRDT